MQLTEVGCADRAVDIIRHGGVVILPSDTVYGVFGDATNSTAIDRIYATKKRRKDNPLGIMVDPQDVHLYAHVTPPAEIFIRMVFPAPVGIILKKRSIIPDFLTSGLDTVMVMCHSQPIIGGKDRWGTSRWIVIESLMRAVGLAALNDEKLPVFGCRLHPYEIPPKKSTEELVRKRIAAFDLLFNRNPIF
jgi:hypothetical protein